MSRDEYSPETEVAKRKINSVETSVNSDFESLIDCARRPHHFICDHQHLPGPGSTTCAKLCQLLHTKAPGIDSGLDTHKTLLQDVPVSRGLNRSILPNVTNKNFRAVNEQPTMHLPMSDQYLPNQKYLKNTRRDLSSPTESESDIKSQLMSVRSLRLRAHSVPGVTVLFIDIKGFTAGCAAMSAGQVGEWVAEFYLRVEQAAAAHGVRKVEVRGDCCVCVTGVGRRVAWREGTGCGGGEGDREESQVTRMLAFAADLHADLATLAYAGSRATSTRMGVASGDVDFLIGEACGGGGFMSLKGEAMRLAARMEALSPPGMVLAHASAAGRWASEGGGRRVQPATERVGGEDDGEAATFDCAGRAFRPAVCKAASSSRAAAHVGCSSLRLQAGRGFPSRLRASRSFP
jgi:class 3 adenylate cyclase